MFRHLLPVGFSFIIFLLTTLGTPGFARAATYELNGVDDTIAQNVHKKVDLLRLMDEDIPEWQLRQLAQQAPRQIQQALRPFGYYQAEATVDVSGDDTTSRHYQITVIPGPPVVVREVVIHIGSPDDDIPDVFTQWRKDWPLPTGKRLDQRDYRNAKRRLERLAEQHGFFRFRWEQQEILISEDRRHADISLAFETGRQAVFGTVTLQQTYFGPALIERFLSIEPGDPYRLQRVDRLRNDLGATGYFNSVAVIEDVDRDQSPAVVNLRVKLERRPPNTYTTTLGFGTDTGPRAQVAWNRHYLSSRGDRLDLALGGQEYNNEYVLRGNYERPRGNDPGEFWFSRLLALREEEDFRFTTSGSEDQVFPELNGNERQLQVDTGLLTEFDRESRWPITQRWFVSFLYDRFDALDRGDLLPEQRALLNANPQLEDNLERSQNVISLGAAWDLRHIQGSGFGIHGTRAQLRLTGAVADIGSDISFAQLYLGVRHSRLLGERHKILVRGEVGYSAAATRDFTIGLDDRTLDLSISQLPEAYRFKAGGDRSVRGYGFESLSNNRIGSNHLVTLSAEYEYRLAKDWSIGAFYDAGNAFNRFDNFELRQGIGVGVRWYSVVGPIRVDFARGLDDAVDELRLHITIGSPLL